MNDKHVHQLNTDTIHADDYLLISSPSMGDRKLAISNLQKVASLLDEYSESAFDPEDMLLISNGTDHYRLPAVILQRALSLYSEVTTPGSELATIASPVNIKALHTNEVIDTGAGANGTMDMRISNIFYHELTEDYEIYPIANQAIGKLTLIIQQDGSGNIYSLTLPTKWVTKGSIATGAEDVSIVEITVTDSLTIAIITQAL